MMVSGAVAVTISAARRRQRRAAVGFAVLTLVLLYALGENIREKPDGIAISALFIAGIVVVSLISRVTRTTELRADHIEFDEPARRFVTDSLAHDGALNIIANQRQAGDVAEYAAKEREQRGMNPVPGRRRRAVPGDRRGRPVRSSATCCGCAACRSTGTGSCGRESPAAPERDRRDPARAARRHRGTPALPLRVGRGQPARAPAAVPDARPRRHRPGRPGDHPQERARPGPPAGHPRRRLTRGTGGSGRRAVLFQGLPAVLRRRRRRRWQRIPVLVGLAAALVLTGAWLAA